MSEEIQSAATVVPQALIWSISINGALAWCMALALTFCMGDLDAALEASMTMFYPALEIFLQAVKSTAGAVIMASIVLFLAFSCSVGAFATASRMLWSFSRDKGTPFHDKLIKVQISNLIYSSLLTLIQLSSTKLPVNAVCVTLVVAFLLSLIAIGSSVALNDILTLSVAALYSSYLIVCILLLWRRVTGGMHHTPPDLMHDPTKLYWGPWRISEPWGTINNLYACLHLSFLFFWSFWPPMTPVMPETMNFSVLLLGGAMVLCVLWYYFRARHNFRGPIREIDDAQAWG
jgi:choline transport protein